MIGQNRRKLEPLPKSRLMRIDLTDQQSKDQLRFREFVNQEIIPHAGRFDKEGSIPDSLVEKMASNRYFGAVIPAQAGGLGLDMITFGLLNEEIGRGCSSVRSLLTVHTMVEQAVSKWGSRRQKDYWVPNLASGRVLAAFALSEPDVGSDAAAVETTATDLGESYVLNGRKRWITGGQIAQLFLVFARCDGKPSAFLVERKAAGLSIRPESGMLGVRASMLAELTFEDCYVPKENLVGRVGFGVSHVAASALDYGRYSVAWGCVGIAQACLEACMHYTSKRKQFGAYLKDHQLIQEMITDMITDVRAARLLCYQAGYLKDMKDPRSLMETSIAKYFASRIAARVATDAVQIHGANGCSDRYPVERFLRDSKVMEIIEGSNQIQQITIAAYGYRELGDQGPYRPQAEALNAPQ